MPIYHVAIDLINPDDADENGTYEYGVREWSKLGAIKSVINRVTNDGYKPADGRAPTATKVGSDVTWPVSEPLCYGKVSP